MGRQGDNSRKELILSITPDAAKKIREYRSKRPPEERLVRITVNAEARAEDKYELEFVSSANRKTEDELLRVEDIMVLVDEHSAALLTGTTIHYVEGMWSSGFRFENPNYLQVMADPLSVEIQRVIDDQVTPLIKQHGGLYGSWTFGMAVCVLSLAADVRGVVRRQLPFVQP